MENHPPIPNQLFFIWLGDQLPWWAEQSILTAVLKSGCMDVTVYFDSLKMSPPEEIELRIKKQVSDLKQDCSKLHWEKVGPAHFQELPFSDPEYAYTLYQKLTQPAAKSNLLRLSILYRKGGIYCDLDTLIVRPFIPLLKYRAFCGLEPVALPQSLRAKNILWQGLIGGFLLGLREIFAQLPRGYKGFRTLESLYFSAVNNAVLAAAPQNPIFFQAFKMIEEMEDLQRYKRFQLGTHLLQRVTENRSSKDIQVLDMRWFYPLGPEISNHWFRNYPSIDWKSLIFPETIVIHWYQSVEERFLKSPLGPDIFRTRPQCPYVKCLEEILTPEISSH